MTQASKIITDTSDDLRQTANKAMDRTREYASDMAHDAQSALRKTARDIQDEVDPMIDVLTAKAQDLAHQSMELAQEAKKRAQKSINKATKATSDYVAEQPLRSVVIAAAVGAAVALLVASSRSRHNNRY